MTKLQIIKYNKIRTNFLALKQSQRTMGSLGVIPLNSTDRWEGSLENTDEYTTAFLHPDWLYFLWRDMNVFINLPQCT